MAELRNKPVLVERVRLWWYPISLLPILALFYAGFTGILPTLFGLAGLFAFFFWVFSFGFAIYAKLRRPPSDPRQ
jgi:hypothetical protein